MQLNSRWTTPLLIVTLLLFGQQCYGQQDSLPTGNRTIIDYVNTKIGIKIKSGICFDFVAEALDQVDPKWRQRRKRFHKTEYVYGKIIKKKNLLPGDIAVFKWKSLSTSRHTSHACIIYSIDKNGKIKVAEQNADGMPQNKTKVEINNFDATGADLGIKIYKLRYYRPY